jgi:hypothetical protein
VRVKKTWREKEIGKVLGERDSASVGPVDALVAACQLGYRRLVFANAQRFERSKWCGRFGICETSSRQMAGR